MKKKLILILTSLAFSCASKKSLEANTKSSIKFNSELTNNFVIKETIKTEIISTKETVSSESDYISIGEKKEVWDSGKIKIQKKNGSNLSFDDFKINIGVSKQVIPSENSYLPLLGDLSKYKSLYNPSTATYEINGIDINNLARSEKKELVKNGNWININISNGAGNLLYSGFFKYKKNYSWFTKVTTPILYVADGDLGEFELRKFSPSIGVTVVQKNLNTFSKWNYLGINALIDIQSWEKEINNEFITKYSLGAGLTFDIANFFQIGSVYNFNQEKFSFVIGMTPDLIQKLFSFNK